MKKTVGFYTEAPGMPLIKTVVLPGGGGQHFFFDCGDGDQWPFFWFPTVPNAQPGVIHAASLAAKGDIPAAHASKNHSAGQ